MGGGGYLKNDENRQEKVAKHLHMLQLFYGTFFFFSQKTSFKVRIITQGIYCNFYVSILPNIRKMEGKEEFKLAKKKALWTLERGPLMNQKNFS